MPKKSASGSGSIRQRKDGTWEGRYSAGYDPGTGNRIRKSVYAPTQKEVRQKLVDKELVRKGLVLDDPEVLSAMECRKDGGYRFLPLKVAKTTGQISGEALVSAQRLGRLQKHIERVLEDICKEMAMGNIAADPFWRGNDKNACRFCEYGAACHFEQGRGEDCRRWVPTLSVGQFWGQIEQED